MGLNEHERDMSVVSGSRGCRGLLSLTFVISVLVSERVYGYKDLYFAVPTMRYEK